MTNQGLVDLRPLLRSSSESPALVEAFTLAIERRRPYFVGPKTPTPVPLAEREGWGEERPLPMLPVRP